MKYTDFQQARLRWFKSKQPTRKHWMEFRRFIVCGVINTGVVFGIYVSLLWFFAYGIAYTISYAVGIFLSYWLNAKFVFEEQLRLDRALQYPLVYLFQYLLGLALLFLFVEVGHFPEVVSPLLIVVLTLPITFLLSRYLIRRSFGLREQQRAGR